MKKKDLEKVKKIFHNKKLYRDNPSCGFSEDVSIVFDDGEQIFEPACDGCGIVYWKNKNKYFLLTDEETTIIHGILQTYNLKFPCV